LSCNGSKTLSFRDARELQKLVDNDSPELSICRPCALLDLPRSRLDDRPTPARESTLRIMVKIIALDLEDPCSGSRRMVDDLANDWIPISRDRVRNLMRRMGLNAEPSLEGRVRSSGVKPQAGMP
jgi:putative transposase